MKRQGSREHVASVGPIDVSHLMSQSAMNPLLDIKKNYVHSYDDLRNLSHGHGRHKQRQHSVRSANHSSAFKHRKMSSTSASESSLDEAEADGQVMMQRPSHGGHQHAAATAAAVQVSI